MPRYRLSRLVLADLVISIFTHQRRTFSRHSKRLVKFLDPAPVILGGAHIPSSGPCLVTNNHYTRPGFFTAWSAITISAAVPFEIHWVMANAWTAPDRWYGGLWRTATNWAFNGVAHTYSFLTMPPMPPSPDEVKERAQAVKRLVEFTRSHPQAAIGFSPEGGDEPQGVLCLPPAGVGRLALELTRRMPILPVGLYEEGNCLCLNFGEPYRLDLPATPDRSQLDLQARQQMMQAIARCLPERLKGAF